jgi:hypothetical protein
VALHWGVCGVERREGNSVSMAFPSAASLAAATAAAFLAGAAAAATAARYQLLMSVEVGESPGDGKTSYVGNTMSSPWGVYGVEERVGVSVSVMGFSTEAAAALLAGAAAVKYPTARARVSHVDISSSYDGGNIMASSGGVYGVEQREGVSVSVMGSVMESVMDDTIGKEMGVSRVEQRERSMLVVLSVALAWALALAFLMSCKTCLFSVPGGSVLSVLERILMAVLGRIMSVAIAMAFGEGRGEVDVVVVLALERISSVVIVVALV